MIRSTLTLVPCLFLSAFLAAQEKPPLTLEMAVGPASPLAPRLPPVQWVPGTHHLSIAERGLSGPKVSLRFADGGSDAAFAAKQLRDALAAGGMKGVPAEGLPRFTWLDAGRVRVLSPRAIYHWKIGDEKASLALSLPEGASATTFTDGDARGACLVKHQLTILSSGKAPSTLTEDGDTDIVYGGAAHRAEFGIKDGLWWDPTGRWLAFSREDQRPIDKYPYADHTKLPPQNLHGRYPMAGRVHSRVTIGVHDTRENKTIYLEHDPELDLYWTNVTFSPDGTKVHVALVNRAQNHVDLVRFDSLTGAREATLIVEDDPQWTEPEHGPIFLPDGGGRFLWFSPKRGFHHLWLHAADGKKLRKVTAGKRDIAKFLGFAKEGTQALVMASDKDPRQMHLWAVDLENKGMRQITSAPGWHACAMTDDGAFVLDVFSSLSQPPRIDLVACADGETRTILATAMPKVELGEQKFFTVKTEDGTPLYGHVILPPGHDPKKTYPLLHYVYGGPHSQLVRNSWLGGAQAWLYFMAGKGFVVSRLDGHGTNNRGIEFSQKIHRQMGVLETRDQLHAIEHVKKIASIDPARIGVHGWSYGGYMTLNLMLRAPEVFACGVSGAPVTDWAQYETGYTERYMDTPAENPEGYADSSMLPRAAALKGRLLIVHGTDDKTVMWSHSLAFVDRCIDAGVLIDYMPYPMQKHGLRGKDRLHLYRLMTRFFGEHLDR